MKSGRRLVCQCRKHTQLDIRHHNQVIDQMIKVILWKKKNFANQALIIKCEGKL